MEYKIIIEGVDYTKYLNLPANILPTNDSTLIQGQFLLLNTKVEKFPQQSLLEFYIDEKEYDMVIFQDDSTAVKDGLIAGAFIYNHTISAIEMIKLTDQYLAPNMAFTQKDQNIVKLNDGAAKTSLQYNPVYDSTELTGFSKDGGLKRFKVSYQPQKNTLSLTPPNIVINSNNIEKEYLLNYNINAILNIENFKNPCLETDRSISAVPNVYIYSYLLPLYLKIDYYKTDSSSTEPFLTQQIDTPVISLEKAEATNRSVDTQTGSIVFEVEKREYYKNKEYPDYNYTSRIINFNLYSAAAGKYRAEIKMDIDRYSSEDFRNICKDIERIFDMGGKAGKPAWVILNEIIDDTLTNNPNIKNQIIYSYEYEIKEVIQNPLKTLDQTLESIFRQMKFQRKLSDEVLSQPLFTLDKTKESYLTLTKTASQDLTFEGKNLFEILKEIGRIIKGVPHMNKDYSIYYDILTNIEENPGFRNEYSTLYKTSSSMDNYATTLQSNISNMVPDNIYDDVSYWPAKNRFQKYRAASINDSMMYPDNAVIRIDNAVNGIYRVKEFKVKNFSKLLEDANKILDLIRYSDGTEFFNALVSKDLWDTYSEDIDADLSKTDTLYYTKGDNKIVLSELTQQQKVVLFGNDTQQFIWQRAFINAYKSKYGTSFDKSNFNLLEDMEFQVVYIPYINSRYTIERSNVAGMKKEGFTLYSQDTQNPAENLIAAVTDTYLKRFGNDDLQKSAFIEYASQIPYIGEYYEYGEDGKYYCNKMNLGCYQNFIRADLNYTKNYNKINQLIGIPKDFQQYSIPKAESVRKYIETNKYFYIRTKTTYESLNSKYPATLNKKLLKLLRSDKINGCCLREGPNLSNPFLDNIFIPIQKYYTSNSVKYQANLYDNFAAGSKMGDNVPESKPLIDMVLNNGVWQLGELFPTERYYQNYVDYVDNYGYADHFIVDFIEYYSEDNLGAIRYPVLTELTPNSNAIYRVNSEWIKCEKDTREALSFILSLHFITDVPGLDIINFQYFPELKIYELSDVGLSNYSLYFYNGSMDAVKKKVGTVRWLSASDEYTKIEFPSVVADDNYDGWCVYFNNIPILNQEKKIVKNTTYQFDPLYIQCFDEKIKTD